MSPNEYARRLKRLVLLAWSQRALRLLLRAAWLGGGGYLLALSIDATSGPLPHQWPHLALAALFAAPALVHIVWPLVRPERLAWRIDRLYGYREQLSAAWEVSRQEPASRLAQPLLADAEALLQQAQRRILRRGWSLAPDLLSLAIIGLLLFLVMGQGLIVPSLAPAAAELAALPPLGSDPGAEQLLPSGIPGMDPTPTPSPQNPDDAGAPGGGGASGDEGDEGSQEQDGAEGGDSGQAPTGSGESGNSSHAMGSAMKGLGQKLSQQGVSYEAGRALQRGDYSDAAREMEVLADQMDQLSAESKDQMADAFAEAAQAMAQQPDEQSQQMAESLQQAAEAMNSGDTQAAERALDQLAADLRALDQQMANAGSATGDEEGAPATDRGAGAAQNIDRLYGDAGTFSLSELGEAGGLLGGNVEAEAQGDAAGETAATGLSGDEQVVDAVLLPSPFSWQWREIVSRYFTRR